MGGRALDPASFAALCEIPPSQAADLENIPGWNDAPDSEKDSPSTGNNDPGQKPALTSNKHGDSPSSEVNNATAMDAEEAEDHPEEPLAKNSSALEASMELSPLPDSPTGLAPVRFDDEEHAGATGQAASPQAWASDALPVTQAPGVGGDSPGIYASLPVDNSAEEEDSPAEKGQPQEAQTPKLNTEASPDLVVKGAGADSSAKPQTMLGTISRVVMKPFGFGGFANGLWAKRASETTKPGMAASDALENPLSPSLGQGPAEGSIDIGSPSAIEARLLSRLPPSPRADAIKQGLHIIEQAHQMGPGGLQLQTPVAGFGTDINPEVVMGRGDSAVAEAISQAMGTPQGVAAAVVGVQLDGATATASLPPTLVGTELGASIAQESIAVAQAAAQQANDLMSEGPSRKRSAEEVEQGEEGGREVQQPRRRRRLRTGMEVVWKFFGVSRPDA